MRPTLAVLALAAAVVFGVAYDRHRTCEDARRQLFSAAVDKAAALPRDAVDTAVERCRGTTGALAAAGALNAHGDRAAALRLARQAAGAEPENASAWRAVAATASGAEHATAERRWAELDPLGFRRNQR